MSYIYFGVLLFSVIPILLKRSQSNNYPWTAFLAFLWLFSALRVNVGYDLPYYVKIIRGHDNFERFEPLMRLLAEVSYWSGVAHLFPIVCSSVLFYGLWSILRRKFNQCQICFLLLFFCIPFGLFEHFSWMRQSASIGFFLIALVKFDNKRYISSLSFTVLSVLSHSSSLLPIFVFCLTKIINKEFNVKAAFVFSIVSLLIYSSGISLLIINVIVGYIPYGGYIRFESKSDGNIAFVVWYLIYAISVFLYLLSKSKLKAKNKELINYPLDSYFFLGSVGVVLYSLMVPFGFHVSRIFFPFAPIVLGCFAMALSKVRPQGFILSVILVLSILGTTYRLYSASVNRYEDFLNEYSVYTGEDYHLRELK